MPPAEGGTVALADEVVVRIPANALAEDTTVTISIGGVIIGFSVKAHIFDRCAP